MKNVYFLSDAHLGSRAIAHGRTQERRLVNFLESIKHNAAAVYLLGDIFDFWYEFKLVVPKGYTRFLGKISELTDLGVEVHFFIGNHDIWLFDYLREEIGLTVADGPVERDILGRRFYISHGDREGEPTRGFRFIQWLFRNRFTQKLYSGIHPRWTVGFAHWWSAYNRRRHHTGPAARPLPVEPLVQWVEENQLTRPVPPVDFYVFGHYHTVVDRKLEGARMIVLGD